MLCRYFAAALLSAGTFGVFPAFADPEVKAGDIVEFFAKTADQGATRGICIGTPEECEPAEPKPTGFDMLINFDLNSADFTPQAEENLKEFAKALADQRLSAARFIVEGHTDALGTDAYNIGLSERRANAVTEFLFENGISGEKVSAVGMGEGKPRTEDPLDAVNRRVEMRIQLQ
ncbi:MAG: OmpA family protein [Pseudaminobacter sp.]|nr:OmpA family protein [Pseudaminobacter sp.]